MKTIKPGELNQHRGRISHLEGDANYTFVYFADAPRLLLSSTLSTCQDYLPGFIRIHRKYAINPAFVWDVQLRLGHPQIKLHVHCLPISRRLLKSVRQALADPELVVLDSKPSKPPRSTDVLITHAPRNIGLTWQ